MFQIMTCFPCSGDLFGMFEDVLYCRLHFEMMTNYGPPNDSLDCCPPPPLHSPSGAFYLFSLAPFNPLDLTAPVFQESCIPVCLTLACCSLALPLVSLAPRTTGPMALPQTLALASQITSSTTITNP